MEDDRQLFELMLADLAGQAGLYQPGEYWRRYCDRIAKAIRRYGLADFRANAALSTGYGDRVFGDPLADPDLDSWRWRFLIRLAKSPLFADVRRLYLEAIELNNGQRRDYQQSYYQSRFGDWFEKIARRITLPETTFGGCQESVRLAGKEISVKYLDHLIRIDNTAQAIDLSAIENLMEIGGGYGVNVHLLLTLYPNIRRILYIDIPPVLYVATQYLKHFFPSQVIDYCTTRTAEKVAFNQGREREIITLCPWQMERIEAKVDLFWNSCSFQEMEENIVRNYACQVLRLLDRRKPGALALIIYPQGDPSRTLSPTAISAIFEPFFGLKEVAPLIEHEKNPFLYLVGRALGGG